MRALLLGANGQLGSDILRANAEIGTDIELVPLTRSELDVSQLDDIWRVLEQLDFKILINCTGDHKTDKIEKHAASAFVVNAYAVERMALVCKAKQARFVQISTDYVFSGESATPYCETDPTGPINIYGASKAMGENLAMHTHADTIIARVASLFGVAGATGKGGNFVETILRLARKQGHARVVNDITMSPTYAKDAAKALLSLLNSGAEAGVYHIVNSGDATWYEFAAMIVESAQVMADVIPIPSTEYPTVARRPRYTVLDTSKVSSCIGPMAPWQEALQAYLSEKGHASDGRKTFPSATITKMKQTVTRRTGIGVVGSGFIARGLVLALADHPDLVPVKVLTRRNKAECTEFPFQELLTNSLDELIKSCDLILECTGHVIHATEVVDTALKANIPVVTMDSEFHVTTGSYFADSRLLSEAHGDQPGCLAAMHEDALQMGFKPLVYGNIKKFLNHNPSLADMEFWSRKQGISLHQTTAFTDGTKVQIEQAFVTNGLGAGIARPGLLGMEVETVSDGAHQLALAAKELGRPISDYILTDATPGGIFIVAEHSHQQKPSLEYLRLGKGPFYTLVQNLHLCHLEIPKALRRIRDGGPPLLNNSTVPTVSVAAVAKRTLQPGYRIETGIGSFDVRGTAVPFNGNEGHVPIGLLYDAVVTRNVERDQQLAFDDVELTDSLALHAWREVEGRVARGPLLELKSG